MTTPEYAQKIVELIDARPRYIDLDNLLDEIDFHAQNAEAERDIQEGRVVTHEQAMEEMWKLIYSKLNGRNGRAKTMQKSSTIKFLWRAIMTTSEYAKKIAEIIDRRPRRIDLDKLLDEIKVRAKIAESRRVPREGRRITNEQMLEEMWETISLKFNDKKQTKSRSLAR
ncbi:MAG: hypothetical protein ACRENG_21240 [bacterium]